jgi:hypothetical protein
MSDAPNLSHCIGAIDGYEQFTMRPIAEEQSRYYSGKKEGVRHFSLIFRLVDGLPGHYTQFKHGRPSSKEPLLVTDTRPNTFCSTRV